MVERRSGSSIASFFVEAAPVAGGVMALPDAAVKHARVRRLTVGDAARVTDGAGAVGWGTVRRLDAHGGEVSVEQCESVAPPAPLALLVPVADRDRMLWLAEKAAEFAITDWRPVSYLRSRSVSPRGEGEAFERKVRARMIGALEQSGGAWLPMVHAGSTVDEAMAECAGVAARFVLDPGGPAMTSFAPFDSTAIAVGPEGGLEPQELDLLLAHDWDAASLGRTTLRFETAAIAATAIVRAAQSR
ncbi:MAG: RsmE family RNA methyltransferase [Gemmatimonadaceae bacterium]